MDTVEVTTTVRITNAKGISAAQINKILQGIKQYHSFPVEPKNGAATGQGNQQPETEKKKLTVALEC